MRRKTKARRRKYLVARGASCTRCKAHNWKAFEDPEERDLMSPCTRTPIFTVWAKNKPEAVSIIKARFVVGEKRGGKSNP